MTTPTSLVAAAVTLRFGALLALDDVSVNVNPGEIVSLIGPNGAGKTTLLNVTSGLLSPERGRILVGGADVSRDPPNKRALGGMRRTFQHARLADDLTVIENVMVGASIAEYPGSLLGEWLGLPRQRARLKAQRDQAMTLLASLDLAGLAGLQVGQLSFGRKKLVDLARALMASPGILLMDEPTAGLSEAEVEALAALVGRLRGSTTILLVAHHMGFVAKVADNVICLVAGRVIARGTPREMQSNPKVLAAYMGTA
ncbi:MAG: ABC transporter ATP-binding protein [Hyphomicrobiales bacterium]|nr:ABC transporter ATP-binding protein [Hyphomicrobiales bacterium]